MWWGVRERKKDDKATNSKQHKRGLSPNAENG